MLSRCSARTNRVTNGANSREDGTGTRTSMDYHQGITRDQLKDNGVMEVLDGRGTEGTRTCNVNEMNV